MTEHTAIEHIRTVAGIGIALSETYSELARQCGDDAIGILFGERAKHRRAAVDEIVAASDELEGGPIAANTIAAPELPRLEAGDGDRRAIFARADAAEQKLLDALKAASAAGLPWELKKRVKDLADTVAFDQLQMMRFANAA